MCGNSITARARDTGHFCKSNWILLRECALLVLPMVIFSTILLGLVIYHQWHHRHAPISGLTMSTAFSSSVFYVDYSTTRLILVASWSSSTVFTLMGSFMTLLSFPLAADMIRNSKGPNLDMLPTPDQLALLIDLLDGKRGAIWRWMTGLWQRKTANPRSVWAVEASASLLICSVLLSLFIIAADTWLHVSTKSVPMLYFADVDPTEAGAAYRFSRALVEDCRDEEGRKLERNSTLPCSVYDSGARLRALHPETIDSILLNNLESSDTIHRDNLTHLSFIGGPSRTSWSFGQRGQSLAPCFNASTFALNFTCSLVQNCRPQDVSQGNGTSRCGAGFSQANIGAWFKLMPWSNPRNYTGDELWSLADDWVVYAPYPSFHIEPGDERLIVNGSSMPVEGSSSFVLRCSPHFFTIKYTWANDTLTKLLAISKADETLRDILRGPLLSDYPYNDDHLTSFAKRLNIPSGGANHPKPYYTQEYAILLSDIGLSFLGGSIEARPAFGLQVQNETIVTQVPKTALFVLIFCNLWYAFTGFCLFLLACYITAYGDKAPDVRAVQELFTVIGLTTAAVSTARSFQNGDLRIGVEKLEDNWRFKVWGHHTDNADVKHCAADEELGLRLKPKDIKSPPVVEVVSIGSTDPGEGGEDVVSTRDDTESRHARAIDDGPVSPVSILEGSILGDDDQMQKRLLQSSDDAHLDSMSADRSTSST